MKYIENSNNKLSETIKQLMDKRAVTLSEVQKNTGLASGTIHRLLSDPSANPTVSTLIPLANYFGVTLNELMGIDPINTTKPSLNRVNLASVPILNWSEAIDWPNNIDDLNINDYVSTDAEVGLYPFALIINDSSLEGFFPNSIIVINRELSPDHGDYAVVVKLGQEKSSLKQILVDDGIKYLRPLNKNYQTQLLDNTYLILGIVIQIRTDRNV